MVFSQPHAVTIVASFPTSIGFDPIAPRPRSWTCDPNCDHQHLIYRCNAGADLQRPMAWTALGHADSSNDLFGQGVPIDLSEDARFVSLEDSDSL